MSEIIDIHGRKTRFCDEGKGRVLVLLHGFPESLEIWETLSVALSRSYRVIRIDLPGFGRSECLGYMHSMEEMAAQVKGVLDELGLRKYVLCGHSMGGYVAMAFAEMFPENVSGLIMFHSSAQADSEEKKNDRDRAISAVKADKKAFVSAFLERLFAPENLPLMKRELEALKQIASETSAQAIIAALEGMKIRKDRSDVLRQLSTPVLFIVGKKDVVLSAEALIAQSKTCRDGRVLLLGNAGHMGFYENPVTVEKGIRGFLRKCYK